MHSPLYSKTYIPNGPLISRTENPVYLMSLGQTPARAVSLQKGASSIWFDASYSNIFDRGTNGNNEVYLDMEIARLFMNCDVGIGRDMELGLELPFLHFNGGYLDAFIQKFHKIFGFPNGGRNTVPNGQFRYRIVKDGQTLYDLKPKDIGFSDMIVGLKYNFIHETASMPAMAWRFRYKIPTGSADTGLGDGAVNFSLGYILEKTVARWHFYLNLDYIVTPGNDRFSELYYNQMLAWLAAVELSVSHPVSIIAQLQGSTPLLQGLGISKWDGVPADLVMGVKGTHEKIIFGNDFFWQWSFSEDIYAEGPACDITTMLVVGVRFGL